MSGISKFRRIVCVDQVGLTEEGFRDLGNLSDDPVVLHADLPRSHEEIVQRIGNADCVLVGWNTHISGEAVRSCPKVRYIGMCCSLYDERSANVDIAAACEKGITVRGIRDYGDEGLVEFILGQLISLYKGLGSLQWGPEQEELAGKRLGIVGFGATGQFLARMAGHFAMDVCYYSRKRKPALETESVQYMQLNPLLRWADIISIHVPRNARVLGREEFSSIGDGAILVNTSLGPAYNEEAFREWLARDRNYVILDGDGVGGMRDELLGHCRVILSDKVGGWTRQARERLTRKVLENLKSYLGGRASA